MALLVHKCFSSTAWLYCNASFDIDALLARQFHGRMLHLTGRKERACQRHHSKGFGHFYCLEPETDRHLMQGMSLDSALQHVKTARPQAHPYVDCWKVSPAFCILHACSCLHLLCDSHSFRRADYSFAGRPHLIHHTTQQ